MEPLKRFLIQWNNRFPYDRKYRKQHNIGFNSPEHRAIYQFDILVNNIEDSLVDKEIAQQKLFLQYEQEMEQDGKFLLDRKNDEDDERLYKALRKGIFQDNE